MESCICLWYVPAFRMIGRFSAASRVGLCCVWICCSFTAVAQTQPPEFRALWVDTFHSGIKSSSQITTLVNDLRAGNFNAVIPEVRKRGDAYYQSNFEPEAGDMTSTNSLAELIAKAHNTDGGAARIEVHAWIVTYNIWNNQTVAPPEPDHPYNLHPDWLTQNDGGAQWDGGNYAFDPGHPEVQRHTFNVAMDIISNYDVDGFNFDYIRYAGTAWGYNPVTVARFNRLYNRTGQPARGDAAWLQFRRDQVTALVRKVYLSTMAIKPHVKISADTITWAPGPTSDTGWTNNSAAYTSVLQDWRSWMQEGMLDINIPMAYFRQNTHPTDYANWINFARDRAFNRHIVIGPGIYLNSLSNSLVQMRMTRVPTSAGNVADGICGYSYAVPTSNNLARSTFLAALTQTNTSRIYETNAQPIFATRVPVPDMPWKTAPTRGHLKGFVYGGSTTNPLDGVSVTVTGVVQRTTISDATGFYGFVDLPPGAYSVSSTLAPFGNARSNFVVSVGAVSTADLILRTNETAPPVISNITVTQITNTSARINWTTDEPANTIVDYGFTTTYVLSVTNSSLVTTHSQTLNGLAPGTTYHFRVRSRDAQGNLATSGDATFTTLATPPAITTHPQSQTVRVSSNAVFSVAATGSAPMTYQWIFNGTNLPGATSSSFTRANANVGHAGEYSVVVSNSAGSANSSNAMLTVTLPNPPDIQEISLLPNSRVRLLIASDSGYPVEVQGSSNLVHWSTITSFLNTNGSALFIDVSTTNGHRYYRLQGH